MYLVVLTAALAGLIVGLGGWLLFQFLRQNGRILIRLDAIDEALRDLYEELEPRDEGMLRSPAPAFELPDLHGEPRRLSHWLGRRLLLIFVQSDSHFFAELAPELAALPIDGSNGSPLPVLITTGDSAKTRRLVTEHAIRAPILVQQQMEVAMAFGARSTPSGCLIDEEGAVASKVVQGGAAILALADGTAPGIGESTRDVRRRRRGEPKGLPAGTLAPEFRLSDLDGREVSLSDHRGRTVLLVFSDPHCGPCDALLPKLAESARATPGVQVLMVSRGERKENRKKAERHGIDFPVLLQKKWEVSKAYQAFGTPTGYFIDEEGRIAMQAGVGGEAVLELLTLGGRSHLSTRLTLVS